MSPTDTLDDINESTVLPPNAIHLASEEETQRAQRHIEFRERKLNNPFHRLFSKKQKRIQTTPSRDVSGEDSQDTSQVQGMDASNRAGTSASSEVGESTIKLKEAPERPLRNLTSFRWAVVYENQRGCAFTLKFHIFVKFTISLHRISLFSIPLYSRCPLFPSDPPNYTVLTAGNPVTHEHQPSVSLEDYPFPDTSWSWVSHEWMIDMRGTACVQQDGFEYNWRFSKRGWRYRSGFLGSGSWVRRRRWMRLMVRNEAPTREIPTTGEAGEDLDLKDVLNAVWQGNDGDWLRMRKAMRTVDIDGVKLEVWRLWLNCPPRQCKRLPSTDYDSVQPSLPIGSLHAPSLEVKGVRPVKKEWLATALRDRVRPKEVMRRVITYLQLFFRARTFFRFSYTLKAVRNSSEC